MFTGQAGVAGNVGYLVKTANTPVNVCQPPEGRVVQGLWTALRLLAPTFPARRALPQTLYVRAEYMTISQRFPRSRF
jgi:hypothetical protein